MQGLVGAIHESPDLVDAIYCAPGVLPGIIEGRFVNRPYDRYAPTYVPASVNRPYDTDAES